MVNRIRRFSPLTDRIAGPRSRAWDITDRAVDMERSGKQIIHLGVGDPSFDTPPAVVDSAIHALRNARTHYSPTSGEPALRTAIAEYYAREFGSDVASEQVTVFAGAQSALFATLLCLAGPGDEVILLEPYYATYESVARAGGAVAVAVPMAANGRFEPDIARIEQAVTDKTQVILANSPGNPSGAVYCEKIWQQLHRLCSARGIWLVSDEVYASLIFDERHCSPLPFFETDQNLVVISSVSKSHAMTGWRIGWTVAPADLTEHLGNLAQCMLFGVSQFAQDAAVVALRESDAAVRSLVEKFRSSRDALCNALEGIDGLQIYRPAGGMFVMVDVSELGIDGEEFANGLLDHSGVAVVPGFAFGDSTQNFVRIGYLTDESELRIAAGKIESFVRSLGCEA